MIGLVVLTLGCLLVPVYVYAGYPLLLWLLTRFWRQPTASAVSETPNESLPSVTLVVSCYNEAKVITAKLDNCLALDYPRELLDILVVSDGSDDGTDDLVQAFTERYPELRVQLIRQEGRLGKTLGLNLALAATDADVVVFSDANAMYAVDAVRQLVRHFALPQVGYVVGAALYTDGADNASAANEDLYWRYELAIKQWESQLHSVVGGDGAIYAIRRSLWEPLQARDINDFVNPLQIVAKGYRGVFDPQARCFEETAGEFGKEAARKERIVNRSVRGLLRVREVMNPFRTGWFSVQVISHKLLRWLIPYFAVLGVIGSALLAAQGLWVFQLVVLGAVALVGTAALGYALQMRPRLPMVIAIPFYFVMVNLYAMRGIARAVQGQTQVTWSSARPSATGSAASPVTVRGILGFAITLLLLLLAIGWPYV
ncbi:glycosyltransferase family 2 protein [Salinispirillum marinum]|uniref:Glycosyltransferase family 2 protein n=2 Tax=Saccharospirillaceae TaxID=255527 RepID=A0ABV8BD17_9GAMM